MNFATIVQFPSTSCLCADESCTKRCYEHNAYNATKTKSILNRVQTGMLKQEGRRERNNLSFEQVNFMSQYKNFNNRCKTFFSIFLHLVFLIADAASLLNKCVN